MNWIYYYCSYDFQLIVDKENKTARLAQTVERGTFNPEVEGSSPSSGVKRRLCTRYVVMFDTV
jgi:hypothetical protein